MCQVELKLDITARKLNRCEIMNGVKVYLLAKCFFRASFIVLNHVYYFSYLAWVAVLCPIKILGFHHLFYKLEEPVVYAMLKMITMWNQWAGYEVLEAGDDIEECLEERTLVLVNHQSTGDVLMLINALITRSKVLQNVMWIMDHFLKYSTFGFVSWVRQDFFIFQGKEYREYSLKALSNHLREAYLPLKRKWLVLFPEGGLLYKRRANSQNYGRKNNLPHLEHVTIPREGAIQAIMNELNPNDPAMNNNSSTDNNKISSHHLKYILDITIGYTKGEPISLSTVLFGNKPPCQTTIFYRLYPINKVPKDNEKFSKWLLERWVEKEKMLEAFYNTGKFPMQPNSRPPTVIKQNILPYLALHVAFLTSTYFLYQSFMLTYQYCCSFDIFIHQIKK